MAITLPVSEDLLKELKARKLDDKDTYEEVIWDLLETSMELSDETKKAIAEAEEDFSKGRTISHEDVKRKCGL